MVGLIKEEREGRQERDGRVENGEEDQGCEEIMREKKNFNRSLIPLFRHTQREK